MVQGVPTSFSENLSDIIILSKNSSIWSEIWNVNKLWRTFRLCEILIFFAEFLSKTCCHFLFSSLQYGFGTKSQSKMCFTVQAWWSDVYSLSCGSSGWFQTLVFHACWPKWSSCSKCSAMGSLRTKLSFGTATKTKCESTDFTEHADQDSARTVL